MFWSGDTLNHRLYHEKIVLPFDSKQIDCAAYTLRMGGEVFITNHRKTGIFSKIFKSLYHSDKVTALGYKEHFTIPAGQFAWLLTKEHLNIPNNVLAFISLKTTYKFQGLINVSGFHVDPGFKGNLVYAVYNAGPKDVRLSEDEDLFLIWFTQLDHKSEKHYRNKEKQDRITEKMIVQGDIISLQGLRDEISALKIKINTIILVGLAISAVVGIIGAGFTIFSGLKP